MPRRRHHYHLLLRKEELGECEIDGDDHFRLAHLLRHSRHRILLVQELLLEVEPQQPHRQSWPLLLALRCRRQNQNHRYCRHCHRPPPHWMIPHRRLRLHFQTSHLHRTAADRSRWFDPKRQPHCHRRKCWPSAPDDDNP